MRALIRIVALFSLSIITPAAAQDSSSSVGIVALVNPDASLSRGQASMIPVAGDDVLLEDRVLTDDRGQVHLMLVDKSSFTVGPNSDVTIDHFVYDPNTRIGDMALSAARGVMRFVGGDISKEAPVQIRTSIGTLGIRGGILLLEVSESGDMTAIFSFGTSLTWSGLDGGASVSVVRPGFMIRISPTGELTGPIPAPPDIVDALLISLEAGPSTSTVDPTEANAPEMERTDSRTALQETAVALLDLGVTGVTQTSDGIVVVQFDEGNVTGLSVVEQQIIETILSNNTVEELSSAINFVLNFEADSGTILAEFGGDGIIAGGLTTLLVDDDATPESITINRTGTITIMHNEAMGNLGVSDPDSIIGENVTCSPYQLSITFSGNGNPTIGSTGSCT